MGPFTVGALSCPGDPRLLLAGLGQDAAAFDSATRGAVLDHHHYPVGVDVGDPRHGGCDFRCETGCFVCRVTGSHPTVDKHRIRGHAVGINPAGGQLVKNDVDISAGHLVDL